MDSNNNENAQMENEPDLSLFSDSSTTSIKSESSSSSFTNPKKLSHSTDDSLDENDYKIILYEKISIP